MHRRFAVLALAALAPCLALACGDAASELAIADGGGDAFVPPNDAGPPDAAASSDAAPLDAAPSDAGAVDAGAASDPAEPGPLTVAMSNASITAASTGDTFSAIVATPSGTGPFPVVVFGHGFQLAPSQYTSYAKHLASHGYLAVIPDFPTGFSSNFVRDAKDLVATIDAVTRGNGARGDETRVGVTGHSRGGKAAVLAAGLDARIKAVLALDPVDGAGGFSTCNTTTECPPASTTLAALRIPVGYLGETLDATGGTFGQACAPAAGNFQVFYGASKPPAFAVDIKGASHMSFLDNPNCGFTCSACATATADHDAVLALARNYEVAFFDRHLRGQASRDSYLTGADAQRRYVASGLATIVSK
jgi:chlorophyllase